MFVCVLIAVACVVRLISPQSPTSSIVATIAFARFSVNLSISDARCAAE